ncbi:MAG: radical SAM protein [Oscillospiraceae bacterium]|nr:radical SAM protein [Oscillospiraceae bacterium]
MELGALKLRSSIKLREEYFGGIVFDKETGNIIELDREAFSFLTMVKDLKAIHIDDLLYNPVYLNERIISKQDIQNIVNQFLSLKLLESISLGDNVHLKEIDLTNYYKKLKRNRYSHLSAPETAHFAVTYKCNEKCPDCYIPSRKKLSFEELGIKEIMVIIDKLCENNVFQLAIGGGEPFLRKDLKEIVKYAYENDLVPHVTTGRYEIDSNELLNYVKILQIGIHLEELLENETLETSKLSRLVSTIYDAGANPGANIIMTKYLIKNFHKIMDILISCGFKRFTFLRYKPHSNSKRWLNENPRLFELDMMNAYFENLQKNYPFVKIRIDCAATFLERNMDERSAIFNGIQGCTAGSRIISIVPDGSVYPCSQTCFDEYKAGNLLSDSFESIWNESEALNKFRFYKDSAFFQRSTCGSCKANRFCSSCHVLKEDLNCKVI